MVKPSPLVSISIVDGLVNFLQLFGTVLIIQEIFGYDFML
jgi:hypothetical protein